MAEVNLERLTIKKLREIALRTEEIEGVHGMSKEELIAAIRKVRGEEPVVLQEMPRAKRAKVAVPNTELKHRIRELKKLKEESLANRDKLLVERYRKRIKKLKRMLRHAS